MFMQDWHYALKTDVGDMLEILNQEHKIAYIFQYYDKDDNMLTKILENIFCNYYTLLVLQYHSVHAICAEQSFYQLNCHPYQLCQDTPTLCLFVSL